MAVNITYDNLRFGDNKVHVIESSRSDRALYMNLIYGNALDYTPEENYKFVLQGIPLEVSYLTNGLVPHTPYSGNPNPERVYALQVIEKATTTPPNPSDSSAKSFVWEGLRLASQQDSDGKNYWEIAKSSGTGEPYERATINGIPLAVTNEFQLIVISSSYSTNDIEEYTNVQLGGSSFTVGRIGNKYYLVIHPSIFFLVSSSSSSSPSSSSSSSAYVSLCGDNYLPYKFSASTTANPDPGTIRYNTVTVSAVTNLYIHNNDQSGASNANQLFYWSGDTIEIHKFGGDPTHVFNVLGTHASGTFTTFDVNFVSGDTAFISQDNLCILEDVTHHHLGMFIFKTYTNEEKDEIYSIYQSQMEGMTDSEKEEFLINLVIDQIISADEALIIAMKEGLAISN